MTWKKLRRAARAAVIVTAIRLLSRVPLGVAFRIAGPASVLGWYLSAGLRRDMRRSLEIAFPEKPPAERDAIARRALANLARSAAESITFRSWLGRMDEYVHVSPEHVALVERSVARGKGRVFVMGHIGNWETTARLARYVQPCAAIAKRSWHPSLDALAEGLRRAGGVATYWRDDPATGRLMLKLFKQGGTLGILIDQDIRDVQSVFVPFFGRLAATPRAAADFALRFDADVVVICAHRRGTRPGDGHVVEVTHVPHDPSAPDREAEVIRLTAACAKVQEEAIRRHPDEWVWMHQRWKTRPPAEGSATADESPTRNALTAG